MPIQIPVSCNRDCGGGCPLLATVEEGRVTRLSNNPEGGPYLGGCVRGLESWRQLHAPDRLTTPLLRTGARGSGEFRAVGWDEALDRVAERLNEIRARYGNEAILPLGGSGSCRGALHNTGTLMRRFIHLFGGATQMYGSYSSSATNFATPYVLGTLEAGIDAATLQHTQMIILWGANIVDNRLGSEFLARIREAKQRGVPVVVVDPRRTNTVRELGTQWLPVLPGTDSALMLALLYVLVTEGLLDRGFIERYAVGFDQLERHIDRKSVV
jgi:anaerobic dimethyl sulfoxide reductase subunit A